MPMDWDKLRVFHAVADAGSFTRAGDRLHLSQSAVSRQVSALEDSLGVPLFHRHARGLLLTEQGEMLYRTAHDVIARLAATQALLQDSQNRPKGVLRVTTTVSLGATWLTPRLGGFLDLYPEIEMSLIASDRRLDLGMREADCAIRIGPSHQPDLVQRHLVRMQSHVFAAGAYIKQFGMPSCVEELDDHHIIAFADDTGEAPSPSMNWLLREGRNGRARTPRLRINNLYGILRGVRAGLGIAALPDFLAHESPNLVRVLPDIAGPAEDAYFVYPEEVRQSSRIKLFRDFLVRQVAETLF